MLSKFNKLTNWQAALIIVIFGFAVFSTGLTSPFQGDDIGQIVNNVPVHSITNVRSFFEGGSFYNGSSVRDQSYGFYRPLQTTVYSILYTIFGPHTFAFHLLQLLIGIACAFILFLVFRYSFYPALSLFLALIFLIHPLDSQVIYAIPYLQDVLCFFFGILSLWLLLRFNSIKSLIPVTVCLFFSLLSKESGIVFILSSLLYLLWWDRKRFWKFAGLIVLPLTLYVVMRTSAVGTLSNPNNAPIDNLSLAGRLFTAPSLPLFYLSKLIFPAKLASAYYWVHPSFSIRYFLLPLLFDLLVLGLVVYVAFLLYKKSTKAMFYTYLFFATWSILGLLLVMQIIPLEMTACETWFYVSMAGVLGMLGVILTVFLPKRAPHLALLVVGSLLLCVLGIRTALRGFDWKTPITLAYHDIAASPDEYTAYDTLAYHLLSNGDYVAAKPYAAKSVSIYPSYGGYYYLAYISANLGDYKDAVYDYSQGLDRSTFLAQSSYEDLSALTLVYGVPSENRAMFQKALDRYRQNGVIWYYLALYDENNNDDSDAKYAIQNAASYTQITQVSYDDIMNNQTFEVSLPSMGKIITIK